MPTAPKPAPIRRATSGQTSTHGDDASPIATRITVKSVAYNNPRMSDQTSSPSAMSAGVIGKPDPIAMEIVKAFVIPASANFSRPQIEALEKGLREIKGFKGLARAVVAVAMDLFFAIRGKIVSCDLSCFSFCPFSCRSVRSDVRPPRERGFLRAVRFWTRV